MFLPWAVGAGGITFLFYLWLLRPIIQGYFPTGDELALEVVSTPISGHLNPITWFTQGFHFYFVTFPEWEGANTDFWRPLANGLFWLYYQAFGTHWDRQLLVGYLMHALVVVTTGYVAHRVFHLNRWLTALVMMIVAVSPAVWTPSESFDSFPNNSAPELIQYPAFQNEILCALLMMCAYLAFINGRLWLLCAITTVALLLKETALTVPVAALVLVGAWWKTDPTRTAKNLVWLVLPLLLWYLAKHAIFEYGSSLYVLASAGAWRWLLKPIRNLIFLPSLLYHGPLAVTREALRTHQLGTLALHGFQLAANTAWWLAVLHALHRAYQLSRGRLLTTSPQPWVCGLVFALGNLCLVILLQSPDPRLSYFWFALGPAAIFAALAERRHGVLVATVLAVCLIVPQFWSMARAVSVGAVQNYNLSKRSAKQLTTLLSQLPPSVHTVYLLDDIVLHGASTEYLAQFAGFGGKIVVVNRIEPKLGCTPAPPTPRYTLTRGESATELDYRAPPCVYQILPAPLQLLHDGQIPRGQWMSYRFQDLPAAPAVSYDYDFDPGDQWRVVVTDPACSSEDSCVWLGLDLQRDTYYVLK